MRAVDHYREAEKVLQVIANGDHGGDPTVLGGLVGVGQIHATLALAGATALQAYSTGDEAELADWETAAGGAS
jgi:hypothetical protein